VLAVAQKCAHCGETLDVVLRAEEEAKRSAEQPGKATRPAWYSLRPLVVVGALLMIVGAVGSVYYYTLDTTATPADSVLRNLGRIQDRQVGLIASLGASGLGLALAVIGRRR
jgi:hypothetical protein